MYIIWVVIYAPLNIMNVIFFQQNLLFQASVVSHYYYTVKYLHQTSYTCKRNSTMTVQWWDLPSLPMATFIFLVNCSCHFHTFCANFYVLFFANGDNKGEL